MLQHTSVQFPKNLSQHNNKEWFDQNRKQYGQAKSDFERLAAALPERLGKTDPTIAHLMPKGCLFRINRDVRFSKDKSPYQTNMGMSIARGQGFYCRITSTCQTILCGGDFLAAHSPQVMPVSVA